MSNLLGLIFGISTFALLFNGVSAAITTENMTSADYLIASFACYVIAKICFGINEYGKNNKEKSTLSEP